VNGVEMSGKSQEEVVSYLRSIQFASVVNIIVSRTDSNAAERRTSPSTTAVMRPLHIAC